MSRGHCQAHTRARDRRRGTAAERGYDARWSRHVKAFIAALVDAGIPPVCGARLPGAPVTDDSLCAAEGLLVFEGLDCDHIEPHHGQDDPKFWDMLNLQLLDHRRCHPRKTVRKDGGFGMTPSTSRDGNGHATSWPNRAGGGGVSTDRTGQKTAWQADFAICTNVRRGDA